MVRKEHVDIKREFAVFAAKVEHLESLKKQLNALDTRGFENEVKVIRSHLNDINSGKKAERALNELRAKIAHRSGGHANSGDRAKLASLSRSLEQTTHALKAKIARLEEMIKKKRRISLKKQLNPQELASVHEIPKLERDLAALHQQLASHMHAKHVKIDSGVGVLVDTRFDDFIGDIKSELTTRLKAREFALDEQLKADLKAREGLFAHRYKALVEEFHARYKKKVHDELKKEVRARFEKQLQERLGVERKKIVDSLVRANVRRLHAEHVKLVERFEREYHLRKGALEQRTASQLRRKSAELEARLVPQKKLLERKLADIHARATRLEELRARSLAGLAEKKKSFEHHIRAQEQALTSKANSLEKERQELDALKRKQLATLKSKEQELQGLRTERSHEARLVELKKKSLVELAQKREALMHQVREQEGVLRARINASKQERRQLETLKRKQLATLKSKEQALKDLRIEKSHEAHLIELKKKSLAELGEKRKSFEHHMQKQENDLHARIRSFEKERQELDALKRKQLATLKSKEQALKDLRIEKSHEAHLIELKKKQLAELGQKKTELMNQVRTQEKRLQARITATQNERTQLERLKRKQEKLLGVKRREIEALQGEQKRMIRERQHLHATLRRLIVGHQKELARHKHQLDRQYAHHVAEHEAVLMQKTAQIKRSMHEALIRKNNDLEREHARKLKEDARKKEAELRANFEKKYHQMVAWELERQKSELEHKKALLEKHVLEQVKKTFG